MGSTRSSPNGKTQVGLPSSSALRDRCGPRGLPLLPALILIAAGCSTAYQPRRSGHIALVIHHGGAMYVLNGREVPIGPLGGDLPGLVSDVPTASASARRARRQLTVGVPGYVGGAGAVVTGLALSGPVGWVVLGAGVVMVGVSLTLMGAGLTNAVDAVNLHNDATASPLSP
jgi:hypothetical protein